MQRPTTISYRRTLLAEAHAIIDSEFAEELMLDDIARRIATSRRQLQRCFNELADESFRDYLTRVRMEHAAEALSHGRLTVRHVARAVGYRQPAQFAKAFRRQYGMSPTEYRYETARRAAVQHLAAA